MRFQDSSYTVFSCFRSKLWSGMTVSGIPNGVYRTADWLGLLHWDPRDPHPEGQMGFHLSGTWDSLGSHAWWDPNALDPRDRRISQGSIYRSGLESLSFSMLCMYRVPVCWVKVESQWSESGSSFSIAGDGLGDETLRRWEMRQGYRWSVFWNVLYLCFNNSSCGLTKTKNVWFG